MDGFIKQTLKKDTKHKSTNKSLVYYTAFFVPEEQYGKPLHLPNASAPV